jgi:hypothetical protein
MKEIVILSCWPSSEYREKALIKLIGQLKKSNKEILIASHYVIPDYIVNMVDYYIYDKTNIIYSMKTLDTYPCDYYFESDNFRLEAVTIAHSAALSRMFNIALNFVKSLDYDYFTIMEADVEFDIEDLKKLDLVKTQLLNEDKKLFFFKLRPYEFPYWENNGMFEIYETICFGGFVDEFMSKLTFPKTIDGWNQIILKDKNNSNFEYLVTEAFKNHKEQYLILDSVKNFFSKSKTNTTSVLGMDGIYCNPLNDNSPVLFLYNETNKQRTYKIFSTIVMPSAVNHEVVLNGNTWWLFQLSLIDHNHDINVIILEDDKIISSNKIIVDKEYIKQQKNRRKIIYK